MTPNSVRPFSSGGGLSCNGVTIPDSFRTGNMEAVGSRSPKSFTTAALLSPIAELFPVLRGIKSSRSIESTTTAGTNAATSGSLLENKMSTTEATASWGFGMERKYRLENGPKRIRLLLRRLLLETYSGVCRLKRSIAGNMGPIRLYDLVNAGPRHRFTTALFEVHNCLGAGYQCWVKGFVRAAKALAGLTFTEEEALPHVQGYRNSNPSIVKYWNWHQKWMAISAINHDSVHEVVLASGRHIRYFNPQSHGGGDKPQYNAEIVCGDPKMRRWFFGGKLTENEIQGTARDVMAEGIVDAEDRGIPTLFTVHDELVTSVPSDRAKEAKAELEHRLPVAAKWALECPLGVEVKISDRYTK